MKSIGTITYHDSMNYGAILQAYALQQVLISLGFRPEIIDYRNPHRGTRSFSPFLRVRHYMWHGVAKPLLAGTERQRRTEEFRRDHLRLSGRTYFDRETLYSEPPPYDVYLTGSDQVWNPAIQDADPSYFLTFAPVGRRRVSYAASFGVSRIPERLVGNYREYLMQIDHLSTREFEGQQIILQLTGRKSELALDPTLLLKPEEWDRVALPYNAPKPYVLCYYMPGDKAVSESITVLADSISSLTGWSVLSIGEKEYMRLVPWRKAIFNAGPAEFLGLLRSASFVVTNSFHGVAFSISYKKPFLVPVNQDLPPERALSSRITTLLKILSLEDRVVPVGEGLPKVASLDIYYQPATRMLEEQRQRSVNFLINALGEE